MIVVSNRKYLLKEKDNPNLLLDGRTVSYVAKEMDFNREFISLILRGKRSCSYEMAKTLVDRFQPGKRVEDYFIKIDKEV